MPFRDRRCSHVLVTATVLATLASGCTHSLLIAKGDPTYRRALERYQRTRALITESLASEDEQDVFMMGEAMFRYRFAAPNRTATAYMAEIAASLIDVPTLESLAGALDLFSLRLKTNDGAVQLWESLLAQHPYSVLAPLALYRLGWAYRKSVVSGLPRTSERAFGDLAKQHPELPLAALATEARKMRWKSPSVATAWSLVPGAGQFYVGEYGSGAIRLSIAVVAAAAVLIPLGLAYERRHDLTWHDDWPLLVSGILGGTTLTIDYTRSYEDALRSVIQRNDREEAEFEERHPEAP